ncbi:MAG: glycosyltransferase involved in cell wall biosynthesis [bacterium]
MKDQHILVSINVRWWNAEAAYAISFAKAFIQKGAKVWLIVNEGSPVHKKAIEANIPIVQGIHLDTVSPIQILLNFFRILRFIDQNKITFINSFKSNGSFLFTWIRKLRKQIQYFKTRGEARPPKKNIFNQWLFGKKGCDGVIAAGDKVKSWVEELELPNQKIKTIYYADSPTEPKTKKTIDEIREELGIKKESKVMALIGRTQTVKGHMVLLEALDKIKEKSLHLLFLVKDLDEYPEELKELEAFIKNHNLEKQVTILGFREDLGDILRTIDFVVVPSWDSEVNCRVTVESFSMGIPVIAFPTGSLPEVIEHQKTGYICEEKSREELIKGLEWINNEERLQVLSKQAQEAYQNRFSLDTIYTETNAFLNQKN